MNKKSLLIIIIGFWTGFLSADTYRFSTSTDISISSGSALIVILTDRYDAQDTTWKQSLACSNPESVNLLDRSAISQYSPQASKMSDYLLISMTLAPLVMYSSHDIRQDKADHLMLYSETFIINTALTQLIKNTVQRKRPYLYNSSVPQKVKNQTDSFRSFVSGHTSTTFMSAVYCMQVMNDYGLNKNVKYSVNALLLSSATATGYLRYKAGRHFPTDILAGAILGSACGYFVPVLHQDHKEQSSTGKVLIPFSFQF